MYHKKPDPQTISLAEWNRQLNEAKPVKPNRKPKTGGVVHLKPDPIQKRLDETIQAGKGTTQGLLRYVKHDSIQEKFQKAMEAVDKAYKNGGQGMARPSKKQALIKKLSSEMDECKDKLLKMDDEIIDSDELSEGQRGLLKIQRSAMRTIINVLDLRIKDLED